jgi:hypothetical protein
MSWREDNRRRSNGELYLAVVDAALKHSVRASGKATGSVYREISADSFAK